MTRSARGRWLPLLVVAAGVAAYANSFRGPFVFDDIASIAENPHVRQLWPLSKVLSAPAETGIVNRPVVCLSLALNYALCGYAVWGYHAVNLAIHLLAGLTLYGIVRRTLLSERLRDRFGDQAAVLACAVATIWAVHPVQTESVTYMIQRAESLMGLFYLLTLYAAVRAVQARRSSAWSVVAVVCCGLGMATKEVAVTAPIMLLLYDRAFGAGALGPALRRRWGLYAGLAATWVIVAVLTWTRPPIEAAGFGMANLTPWQYALSQFGVIVHYLGLCFWPAKLCFDYAWPVAERWPQIVPAMLVVLALAGVSIWGLIRNHALAYPAIWFFAVLAPTSSVMPIADLAVEHRLYLPLAGLVALLVPAGYALLRAPGALRDVGESRSAPVRRTGWVGGLLVIAVVIALGWRTARRNQDYRSAVAIWQAAVDVAPRNPRAHHSLGNAFRREGEFGQAIEHYHRSLELLPGDVRVHNNLGLALMSQRQTDEAITQYRHALRLSPDFVNAHTNLGNALAAQGKTDEAIRHYRQALELRPDLAEIHSALGAALASNGELEKAIACFREAVRLAPGRARFHYNLATALTMQGQLDEAITRFQRALQIDPRHADTHYNLGRTLVQVGQLREGLHHFCEAARLKPAWPAPPTSTAWILATHPDVTVRDPDEAIRLAEGACQLGGRRDPESLDTLAAAYAAAGQFERAVSTGQAALAAARAARAEQLADDIRQRIALYRQGKPYREAPSAGLE